MSGLLIGFGSLVCIFFGIIFVRRGLYTNGIFKFQLRLPPKYNDTNQHPEIVFSSSAGTVAGGGGGGTPRRLSRTQCPRITGEVRVA